METVIHCIHIQQYVTVWKLCKANGIAGGVL